MTPPRSSSPSSPGDRVSRLSLPRPVVWPTLPAAAPAPASVVLRPSFALASRPTEATPARPAAVLVPAATAWLASAVGAGLMQVFVLVGLEKPISLPLVAGGAFLLTALALGAGFAARVLAGSPAGRGGRGWWQDLAAAGAVALGNLVLGPLALSPLAAGAAALLASASLRGAVTWRRGWMSFRPERVSLLAPDLPIASVAVAELERIPGLCVASVMIPDTDSRAAQALLRRPVTSTVDGRVLLERRVVVARPMRHGRTGEAIARLVARGHEISSASQEMRRAQGRVDVGRVDPLSLLLARPRSRVADVVSRGIDVVGSLVLLVVLAPLFAVIALAIVLESGGPVLFRQTRVGRHGRSFAILKFRSMRPDAEARTGPVWASRGDPRVTKVGRVLRLSHLDELPQLLNVLLGHMSLVGPRPERPHFLDRLRDDVPLFELRTCVRPGITGWAQVRLPYAADSEDCRAKLEYDLYYVLHRSPWFDLAILLDTVAVALRGSGAR